MELLSPKFLISSPKTKLSAKYSTNRARTRTARIRFQRFPLIIHSKKSVYQDFQEYAKPSRLLPAMEVKIGTNSSLYEKAATFFKSGRFESLYKVKIQTSNIYGSGLSDLNSGVLICLIDENGSSILQRLPPNDNILHFQCGSVDEFSFEGPKLGRIVAVWISPESGQWRIGGLTLTIFSHGQSPTQENKQISGKQRQTSLQYNFEVEDILLGEKTEISMIEFRPRSVTTLTKDFFDTSDSESLIASNSFDDVLVSNQESMKEYADLKFSLLFYDVMLILFGSSIANLTIGENGLYAFFTGGICGFLYLLLLQRSVDGLSAPELVPGEGNVTFGRILERLKGPILSLVLALAFATVAKEYDSGNGDLQLMPKDLLFGVMGFLMCKVSVVLAAWKPMSFGMVDSKE